MREGPRALVIDGGKSKTAAAIVDGDGSVLSAATGPGLAMIAEPGGPGAVHESLAETLGALGALEGSFGTAVFGLNGVHAPSRDAEAAAGILHELIRTDRAVVTSDGVLGYVGALGIEAGVAVTAGTGAVLLAMGADGRVHRVDGDGPLLGDRGSGYALGLAGLREAMRVLDGLDGSPMLAEELRGEYGTADAAVRRIHAGPSPTRMIAAFSRNVAAAARRGDAVARSLWREAGTELARGVVAAASRAGLAGGYSVAFSGGLFAVGDLLCDPLVEELARIAPDTRLRQASGDAIAGGAALALSPRPVLTGVSSWLSGRR